MSGGVSVLDCAYNRNIKVDYETEDAILLLGPTKEIHYQVVAMVSVHVNFSEQPYGFRF